VGEGAIVGVMLKIQPYLPTLLCFICDLFIWVDMLLGTVKIRIRAGAQVGAEYCCYRGGHIKGCIVQVVEVVK
jgi:hypothetical protein